jgi:exportin-2 (importin alpha re-exporter)
MQANQETLTLLSNALTSTVSPDAPTRRAAEEQLQQGEKQPGFLLVVLDLVRTASVPMTVRQSGGVYFKNAIKRLWSGQEVGNVYLNSQAPL